MEFVKDENGVFTNTSMAEFEKTKALREEQKKNKMMESRLDQLEEIIKGLANG